MYSYRFFLLTVFLLSSIAVAAQTATKTFTTPAIDNSILYAKCQCPIDDRAVLTDQNLDTYIQRLQTDSFTISTDKKAIPRGILRQLACLAGQRQFITNPGEYYQRTDVQLKRISPLRQLIYLAKSNDILVMTYRKGGWGASNRILLVKFNKHGIVDFWSGFGEDTLNTNTEVVEYIQQNRAREWGLHTNYVSF